VADRGPSLITGNKSFRWGKLYFRGVLNDGVDEIFIDI